MRTPACGSHNYGTTYIPPLLFRTIHLSVLCNRPSLGVCRPPSSKVRLSQNTKVCTRVIPILHAEYTYTYTLCQWVPILYLSAPLP